GILHGFGHRFPGIGLGDDLPRIAFVVEVFAPGFEHDAHQLLFVGCVFRDSDQALLREHEADRVGLAQIAAIFRKGVADFADRAVTVVRGAIDNYGHAARAVALEGDFLVLEAGYLSGPALDSALDI